MKKHNIFLIYGGYSDESSTSIRSAQNVSRNIDTKIFNLYKVILDVDGYFYQNKTDGKKIDLNGFKISGGKKEIVPDFIFSVLHGTPGEDGKLQSLFELLKIPFFSVNSEVSKLTFNKYVSKLVARDSGISVANSVLISQSTDKKKYQTLKSLSMPVFIKPNKSGSSNGIKKINDTSHLEKEIEQSISIYDEVIIEEAVEGREFSIGVFKLINKIYVTPASEALLKNHNLEFWTQATKITPGLQIGKTPANITTHENKIMRKFAKDIFHSFGNEGVMRIDFIMKTQSKHLYLLEVNTIPGLSKQSIFPKQLETMGMSLKQFITSSILSKLEEPKNAKKI